MSGVSEHIVVGKIVKVRGLQGELVVLPLTDFPERFAEMETVLVESPDGLQRSEFEISSVRHFKSQILLRLSDVNTRDDAETLVGSYLCITKDKVIDLPEDSFYQFEILGMEVVTEDGRSLGAVAEIMQFPANDVWRIEGKEEILLPAIKDVIRNVDRENRQVTVRLIAGLIAEKKTDRKG